MRVIYLARCIVVCSFTILIASCVPFIKWEIQSHLASRPYASTFETATDQNWTALAGIGQARVLVDVPATAITPILTTELKKAIAKIRISGGWAVSPSGEPTIEFLEGAIRVTQSTNLTNSRWGETSVALVVDGIPHLNNDALIVDTGLAQVRVESLSPFGFHLPGVIDSEVSKALDASLDNLNSLMPSVTIPATLPPDLVQQGLGKSAILVTQAAVAVMLGTSGGTRPRGKSYTADFLSVAREVYAGYVPGSNVIAAVNQTQDFSASAEQARAQAVAANLATVGMMMGVSPGSDLSKIGTGSVSSAVLVSASSDWLCDQLRAGVLAAIAKFQSPGIKLTIPPEQVSVKIADGAVEAAAGGTAAFLNDTVTVQFSVVMWAVVQPSADGMQARYLLRDLKIESVSVKWDGRVQGFKVPYESALGSLAAAFIGTLPTSDFPIPNLPIDIKATTDQNFTLIFTSQTVPEVSFLGRAVLLSPRRVDILVVPKLGARQPISVPPAPVAASGQYEALEFLMEKAETFLNGSLATQKLAIYAAKPALASLVTSLFAALNPYVEAQIAAAPKFGPIDVKALPGNGTCNAPCQQVSSCGDIGSCKINVCSEVVTGTVCNTICPQFVPGCNKICNPIKQLVCHSNPDNDCLNRVNSCVSSVGTCAAAWGSGLEATCRVALTALNGAGFNGLMTLSGSVSAAVAGVTQKNAQIKVPGDLSSLDLLLVASAQGTIGATMHIEWKQFGTLLLCPSGNLSGSFSAVAPVQPVTLHANLEWKGGTTAPLVGVATPNDISVDIRASEPPIQTLVRSNPALLTCTLGQTVVGLGLLSVPHVTQDLLASALRGVLGDKNGAIAAAVIDGRYTYTGHLSPISFTIPSVKSGLAGQTIEAFPALTPLALSMSTTQ